MRRTLLTTVLLLLTFSLPARPDRAAAEEPHAAPESRPAGTLRLLPQTRPAPAADDALADTTWLRSGLRNILGQGTDEVLHFRRDKDHGFLLDTTLRSYPSVNDKAAAGQPKDTTSTAPCAVEDLFLRLGDGRHTFYLDPGKTLVLDALLPLGDGRWYYTVPRETGAAPKFGQDEMLLEFADDPTRQAEGKGTYQACSAGGPRVMKRDFHFTSRQSRCCGRLVEVVADDANHARLAQFTIPRGGAYGVILDRPNQGSKQFAFDGQAN